MDEKMKQDIRESHIYVLVAIPDEEFEGTEEVAEKQKSGKHAGYLPLF